MIINGLLQLHGSVINCLLQPVGSILLQFLYLLLVLLRHFTCLPNVIVFPLRLLPVKLAELVLMLLIPLVERCRKLRLQVLDLVEVCLLLLKSQVIELLFHSLLVLVLLGQLLEMVLAHLLDSLQMFAFALVHLSFQLLYLVSERFDLPKRLLMLDIVRLGVLSDRLTHCDDVGLKLSALVLRSFDEALVLVHVFLDIFESGQFPV